MSVLYALVSNQADAEILTMILIIICSFAYLSFIWGTAKKLGTDMTNFEWLQVYFLGTTMFICGTSILGKMVAPSSADAILGFLGLDNVLTYLTKIFQIFAMAALKAVM